MVSFHSCNCSLLTMWAIYLCLRFATVKWRLQKYALHGTIMRINSFAPSLYLWIETWDTPPFRDEEDEEEPAKETEKWSRRETRKWVRCLRRQEGPTTGTWLLGPLVLTMWMEVIYEFNKLTDTMYSIAFLNLIENIAAQELRKVLRAFRMHCMEIFTYLWHFLKWSYMTWTPLLLWSFLQASSAPTSHSHFAFTTLASFLLLKPIHLGPLHLCFLSGRFPPRHQHGSPYSLGVCSNVTILERTALTSFTNRASVVSTLYSCYLAFHIIIIATL